MTLFYCDYEEGAHPRILQRMAETNFDQYPGYGLDSWCEKAASYIKRDIEMPEATVHFLVGGTQTNKTVIASILKPYEGVLSADTGHIATHESGAIEATGHKVLTLPSVNAKITGAQVAEAMEAHLNNPTMEHTVRPGMVYISQPTESGTLYTKKELEELHAACRKYRIPLFVDGARLGYALACAENDVTMPVLARNCDVFYIGGTKVGALFGEAVVVTNKDIMDNFRYLIKQHGGMLAKGWLLGIQFATLFEDGLYYEISKNAVELAMKVRAAIKEKGYIVPIDSPSNQQFCIMPEEDYERLSKKYGIQDMGRTEGGRSVRICTSWATKPECVDELVKDILNK